MATPKPVRRLERERHYGENSQTLSSTVGNRGFRTVKVMDIIDIRPLFIRMTSLKEVRN